VSIGPDWKVSAGQTQLDYTFKSWEIKGYVFEGVTLKGSVAAVASVKVEPNIAAIASSIGSTGGAAAGGGAAGGGAAGGGGGALAAADVILDVAIPAALALVAIGTIVGVADMFVQKANLSNLNAALNASIGPLRSGLYEGLAGHAASGSGDMYKAGYDIGHQAYQTALDKYVADLVKQRGFPPTPDEWPDIQHDAEVGAKKAVATWKGLHEIEDRIRAGLWHKWADENNGALTFLSHAQEACQSCFGVPNEPPDGPHMIYWAKKSSFNHVPGFWSID
jgi:hypothetical protein